MQLCETFISKFHPAELSLENFPTSLSLKECTNDTSSKDQIMSEIAESLEQGC
jgi:hypothetical protein